MKTIKLLITYVILLTTLMTCTTVPNTASPPSATKPAQKTEVPLEKIASPVITPAPYIRYNATGLASWYQLSDHGLKTDNGEVYDLYRKTAAHANLPFGSRVKVTNLANDKSVIVIINDRIRSGESLVHLSYIVAKQLQLSERSQVNITTLPPLK